MCNAPNKLIFCSCTTKDDKAKLIGAHEWTLYRFIGSKESQMRGKMVAPSNHLDADISLEDVLIEMNARNCFDFEYIPQEKDSFQMNNGGQPDYKYFNLIFKNGKWESGSNPGFGRTILETIAKGRLKLK